MEALGRTALCVCSVLFILTEVSADFIYIPSLVHHGVEGKSLLLAVETRFPLDKADIQGTWSHTRSSGTRTTLVTFTKRDAITNMMYRNNLFFKVPNISLAIHKLHRDDEGDYHLSLNIEFHNNTGRVIKEERNVRVTVDVPVSSPVIAKSPTYAVVEDKANVTMTCSVERGTRVAFQWMRDNVLLGTSTRYHFSKGNATLLISPVRKEDKGSYRCVAGNPVSPGRHSRGLELNVYYGPYNLEVNSGQGLRTGEVFTINPGELAFFECQADSNPPNSYVWISKSHNSTQVITEGPRLEVLSYRLAQPEEYLCRAFNNVTQKQNEAQFTLVVAGLGTGKEKHTQGGDGVSPLAVIIVCSLFIIGCMLLFFLRRNCHPKRVLMSIYNRPLTEQKRPHRSGHEDATEDFGIYEFVSIPGKMDSAQVSCRSLARLESVQDMHTTIYDVIRHVPESPSHSLLK
ncbi:HEPACAM family member 2 [Solea senegalensis]|uniref:HEPACAM family member 2 n=1 Tax=Solea senegalensis TaxID=28829 RepID=A0AAV6R6I4_SOLSE|nr:HEPACAM family member 2 isoform X1 [Solea senegalensis]XP_043907898.1 HEPACAM family member 2 isoform X1 [Solea senegalensis]XP_043907899.1 HEPACAM family member 2 isoform X1 [Solea senegalensis]XP_043907900.1 HEPACAM family member 2 isoform X1 [Solea senegalensis]KAG7500104.1 HEPACAM family member 2 [Solea senegalensis]